MNMARKGYEGEKQAKKELIEKYGFDSVIKVAIGGAMDFIVWKNKKVHMIVEVKECHSNKFYQNKYKEQFSRISEFAKKNRIKAELWIYYLKQGKKAVKEVRKL